MSFHGLLLSLAITYLLLLPILHLPIWLLNSLLDGLVLAIGEVISIIEYDFFWRHKFYFNLVTTKIYNF